MGSAPSRRGWAASPTMWVLLGFAVFPFIPYAGRYLSLATEVVIWSLFALGFNILLGYTGLPSFGHGAFFGIGAYAAAITFLRLSPGVWGPLLAATVAAGLSAMLIGGLVARKRGIYFALITIAVSQVFYFVAFRWDEVTGGETGLSGIDRLDVGIPGLLTLKLANGLTYYYFVLVIFAACMLLIWRIVLSLLPIASVTFWKTSGATLSREAMRNATCAWVSSGKDFSKLPAASAERLESTTAMVCGCSFFRNMESCWGSVLSSRPALAATLATVDSEFGTAARSF